MVSTFWPQVVSTVKIRRFKKEVSGLETYSPALSRQRWTQCCPHTQQPVWACPGCSIKQDMLSFGQICLVFSISFNSLVRDLFILSCQFQIPLSSLVSLTSVLRPWLQSTKTGSVHSNIVHFRIEHISISQDKSTVRMERRTVLPRTRTTQGYPGLHIKHPTFLVCI